MRVVLARLQASRPHSVAFVQALVLVSDQFRMSLRVGFACGGECLKIAACVRRS